MLQLSTESGTRVSADPEAYNDMRSTSKPLNLNCITPSLVSLANLAYRKSNTVASFSVCLMHIQVLHEIRRDNSRTGPDHLCPIVVAIFVKVDPRKAVSTESQRYLRR
jgi:hypothetical protein